jgi:hypothetical protein
MLPRTTGVLADRSDLSSSSTPVCRAALPRLVGNGSWSLAGLQAASILATQQGSVA